METEILIIGGGLSGLHTAYQCSQRGLDFHLIEARNRLGGRVFSCQKNLVDYDEGQAAFDLGPSWFWPGQQRMHALIEELGLNDQVISQNSHGDALYEDQQGNIQRGITGVSMAGAYRLKGGMHQLTSSLSNSLEEGKSKCNAIAKSLSISGDKINALVEVEDGEKEIQCDKVILAMPPRVALAKIKFTPHLSEERKLQLNNIATWMAGHAKLVCVYEDNFWQQRGMSGDAVSHKGPLQEIHDASSGDGRLNALFGFVGVPPVHRINHHEEIKKLAIAQLVRLFGDDAINPMGVFYQDWSTEQFTATQYDQEIQRFHPANNIAYVEEPEWNGRVIWSGTESADYRQHNNGFLEGALEASTHAIKLIANES